MIPSKLVLVLEEVVTGSLRMVRNVEGQELAVVNRFVHEVAVKIGHHDINKNRVCMVYLKLLGGLKCLQLAIVVC